MTYRRMLLDSVLRGAPAVGATTRRGIGLATGSPEPEGFSPIGRDARDTLNRSALIAGAEMFGIDPNNPTSRFNAPTQPDSILDKVPKPVMGALRGIASALEPFQLPQDILFAAIAGAADKNTTISQRMATIKLGEYVPGGDAPARPASGEEIFKLVGFSPEVSKWAGIAADLTVDPLVFGSWLRVTGKATKIGELVTLGNRVDRFMSPLGMATDVNNVLRRSASISAFQDARMERLLGALRNPDSVVFGIQRFGEKATRALGAVLPRDQMLRLRLGREAGQELFEATQRAVRRGVRVPEEALLMLQNAKNGVYGPQGKSIIQNYIRTAEAQSLAWESRLSDLSPSIRELVETETYTLQSKRSGAGFIPLAGDIDEVDNPILRRAMGEVQAARAEFPSAGFASDEDAAAAFLRRGTDDGAQAAQDMLEEARGRIRSAVEAEGRAKKLTADAIEANQRKAVTAFNNYSQDTAAIDAMLGFHLSGYESVADTLRSSLFELTQDMTQVGSIFNRIWASGANGGKRGLEALRDESTGIRLTTDARIASDDLARKVRNQQARLAMVDDYLEELARIKAADKAAREAPNLRRDAIIAEASEARDVRLAAIEARRANVAAYHESRIEQIKQYADADDVRFAEALTEAGGRQMEALTGSADGLIPAFSAYVNQARDFMMHQAPREVVNSTEGRAFLNNIRKLESQAEDFKKALSDIVTHESVTRTELNKFLQVQRRISLEMMTHARTWQRMEQRAQRMTGARLSPQPEPVSGGARAARKAAAAPSTTAPRMFVDALDLQRLFAPESNPGYAAAYAYADSVVDTLKRRKDTAAIHAETMAAERATANAYEAAMKGNAARATDEFKATASQARQEAREGTAAVKTEQKARAAVEAAERAAEGLPRPGSAADLRRVAAQAPYIRRSLPTRVKAVPYEGVNPTMDDILNARVRAKMEEASNLSGVKDPVTGERVRTAASELDMDALIAEPITYGELLDRVTGFQALDLGDYLSGLMDGHLRRAYGLFIDGNSYKQYIDRLMAGDVIIRNQVLDESDFNQYMPNFPREADMLREYHQSLAQAGGGNIIRRGGMIDFLESRGVEPARIRDSLAELDASLNRNPEHLNNIHMVREYQAGYERALADIGPVNRPSRIPLRNQAVYQERMTVPQFIREQLGEYANATFSVMESAEFARRVLPRQNYFQEAYAVAKRNGLIKNAPFVDEWGTHYRKLAAGDGTIGGFGGSYVHPYLLTELERMAKVEPGNKAFAAYNRVRSLITGGYLAAPSVLAANFMGGLYQGATVGINPVVMLRRMAEVLPDMTAMARGERSELIAAIQRNFGDIDMVGLVGSEQAKDVAKIVKREVGFGEQGIKKLFEDVTSAYEDFLQRPGLGKMRVPFAGLQGFQFTENWFKVATYKEISERLAREGMPSATGRGFVKLSPAQIERQAAEFARTVVFDYSTLPDSLNFLKKTGLTLFPGFGYFLAGRTLAAAVKRPGVLAVSDRMSEAFMNAALPVEEQVLAYLGMPDYLREDQGVPLPLRTVTGKGDNKQVSMIPLAQLIPTATLWDSFTGGGYGANPFAESITQLGLWGPLFDMISALVDGSGEAPITGKFGNRVFDPGTEGGEKAGQVLRFLFNTMAPSVVRKGFSFDYQGRAQGLLPAAARGVMDVTGNVPQDFVEGVYSIYERRSGRPDKAWQDQIVANFLRSPTTVALEGPLAGIRDIMTKERANYTAERSALATRYERAMAAGDNATAAELRARVRESMDAFNERWSEYLAFNQAYTQQRRRAGEGE